MRIKAGNIKAPRGLHFRRRRLMKVKLLCVVRSYSVCFENEKTAPQVMDWAKVNGILKKNLDVCQQHSFYFHTRHIEVHGYYQFIF